MNMLLKISVRNLFRQKRRNVLLGIGIAFGMAILIVSNAFAHGLSDILLNKIIKWMTGHILVTMQEKQDKRTYGLIRDKERFNQIIQERIAGDKVIYEGISTQNMSAGHSHSGRALGNGTSEFLVVVGMKMDDSFTDEVEVLSGNHLDINDTTRENPILLYDKMAEKLNVGVNDTIRVQFSTVYGQVQAAQFTVVAILRSTNPFMSFAAFTSQETLRPLVGLMPQETASLSIVMTNLDEPKRIIEQAKLLHDALQPGAAGYIGTLKTENGTQQVAQVLAVLPEDAARTQFAEKMSVTSGELTTLWNDRQAAFLSQKMAQALGVTIGDPISAVYETKFEGMSTPRSLRVGGIFQATDILTDDMVFVHEQELYETSIPAVPKSPVTLAKESALFPLTLKEWTLLEMTYDEQAYQKKHKLLRDSDWKGRIVEVNTMFELASDVLKMETVLDIVTLVAVFVLFLIILIGVVNTLRMTIRERTREIGTIRAIGMQRGDVRWSFVLEVVLLAFFASLVGLGVGYLAMYVFSLPKINSDSMFTMFLLDKHLHFLPTVLDAFKNLAIILTIAFLTSFFPANRAAKMSVADALRHFE
ncbi:hypothetical protein U14_01726 [Candidatus Moduliflexus flocculans]|uniref:ABC3 transporter permease protein domain-containing protein n=1 Tax=Candidatus Moduliflexus flocculans TaxID=1499966 RepID=A0A0S6VWZ4_9BACT|nr:hypothetical protein U14_01726 [Candidatus Moduliflexus flocculans]